MVPKLTADVASVRVESPKKRRGLFLLMATESKSSICTKARFMEMGLLGGQINPQCSTFKEKEKQS